MSDYTIDDKKFLEQVQKQEDEYTDFIMRLYKEQEKNNR